MSQMVFCLTVFVGLLVVISLLFVIVGFSMVSELMKQRKAIPPYMEIEQMRNYIARLEKDNSEMRTTLRVFKESIFVTNKHASQ